MLRPDILMLLEPSDRIGKPTLFDLGYVTAGATAGTPSRYNRCAIVLHVTLISQVARLVPCALRSQPEFPTLPAPSLQASQSD